MFFIKIWAYIKTFFWAYIMRPLRKWYNLCIRGMYMPDNARNQQMIQLCAKILEDENYQPANPVEYWIDNEWRESYKDFIKPLEGSEIPSYEECRKTIASRTLIVLSEYAIIKER